MKVSYVKSLASYGDPESCVHIRKGVGEALTGGRAARVLCREIPAPCRRAWVDRGAEAVGVSRRSHRGRRNGETQMNLALSNALRTPASTLFGNREVQPCSVARWEALLTEGIEKLIGVQRSATDTGNRTTA